MSKFEIETFIRFPSITGVSLNRLVYVWATTPADARQAAVEYVQNDVAVHGVDVTAGKAVDLGADAQ